jgi:hypothetical protein
MAISGAWLEANQNSEGAQKWGTGINAVHSIFTGGPPLRSSPVITGYGPGQPGNSVNVEITDPGANNDWDYLDQDYANSEMWGYGEQTGTADRPSWGQSTEELRNTVPDEWPGAPKMRGLPGGTEIRAINKGATDLDSAKLGDKEETVGEGWENKQVGSVTNAKVSDPSQYEMQTSMTQRDKVREGSQRGDGSASEYSAPIGSWRPTWGQRIKPWSGFRRHYDMFPFQAEQINRPFLSRQSGTGYAEWMKANEAYNYQVSPLQRQPVPDPYAGFQVPDSGNVYQEESGDVSNWVNVWY